MTTQNRANNFFGIGTFEFKDKEVNNILNYALQDYTVPSVNLGGVTLTKDGIRGMIPGDTLEQEQSASLQFILDEDLKVLLSLRAIQKTNSENGFSDDIFVVHISDNKHNIIAKGVYKNVWISNISGIQYSTKNEETTVYVDVVINFLDFDLI